VTQYRIHGFATCPFCQKARTLLEKEGIAFEYHEINDPEERRAFLDAHGFVEPSRTFPKVYRIDGDAEILVGGYAELEMNVLFGL